jgi:hypothetical protein
MQPSKSRRLGPIIVTIVLVVLVAVSAYLFVQNRRLQDPTRQERELTAKLQKQLRGKLAVGKDEQPLLYATVSDPAALAEQPFYQKAQQGDVVLLYQETGLAVLYRQETRQIVSAIPVGSQDPAAAGSQGGAIATPTPAAATATPKASGSPSSLKPL